MTGAGSVVERVLLDTGAGRAGLVRRLVGIPRGSRWAGSAGPGGELWFVIAGNGRVAAGTGPPRPVHRDTGLWLPPGTPYELSAGTPDELSAGTPDDLPGTAAGVRLDVVSLPAQASQHTGSSTGEPVLASLRDCPAEVTGDRRFRVLFGPGRGCDAATQFVGEIPPGRAPDHSHTYDEVVLVLAGEGVLHTGAGDRPLAPGSCVHLPPGQPHCLENTGQAILRVLGVFHPGGSPAAKHVNSR